MTVCCQLVKICNNYIPFDMFPTRYNVTQFIYFWKTALRVSGRISTHHQEHTQLYLQHLVPFKPLTLPATTVEEMELIWVWCGNCIDLFWCGYWRKNRSLQFPHHTQISSNSSTIAGGSSNGFTGTRYCKYSCVCSWWWV